MSTEPQMPLNFAPISGKSVEAKFDGGNVTSDAGVLFLRAVEKGIGLIHRLAEAIHDLTRSTVCGSLAGGSVASAGVSDHPGV